MNMINPILVYFPQWQGAGLTNNVQIGAKTLLGAFPNVQTLRIPLSDEPLTSYHNISGYRPLVTQFKTTQIALQAQQPDRLLLITGDCGAEVAPIQYLNKHYKGDLTVLWLDAHADLNSPESSPSGHFHGMPLRLLLDGSFDNTDFTLDTPLTNQQVIFVGLRDTDAAENSYISDNLLPVFTDTTFSQQDLINLLTQRNAKNIYIHLDLDILNPVLFPALQYPTPGGIDAGEVAQLIGQLIDEYNVVGLSLTETIATKAEDLRPIQSILTKYNEWLASPN